MSRIPLQHMINGAITLFVVITLTFFMMRLLPGGPFDQERKLPPQIQANLEAKYHLDKPLLVQYTQYLKNILHGDLGPSYKYTSRNVNDIVKEASLVSFSLGICALLIGISAGIILGIWAGTSTNRWLDGTLSSLGMSSISMPNFIFGALLVFVFAYYLNLLPAARLESPQYYILPVLTLALTPFAYTFLLIRTTAQEIYLEKYILIKHSFGIPEYRVLFRHVLRNALIPLISILGPMSAAIITGSFAVELIFAIPGLGKYFVTAVSNRDYTLVMGITIIYSSLLILFNMGTDMLYGWIDPRMRNIGEQS